MHTSWLRSAVKFLLFDLMALATGVVIFNLGVFQSTLEKFLAQKTGAKVQLGAASLRYTLPVTFAVGPTRMEMPLLTLSFRAMSVELRSLRTPYLLQVELMAPEALLNPTVQESDIDFSASTSAPSTARASDLQVHFRIHDGHFKSASAEISQLEFTLLPRAEEVDHFQAFGQGKLVSAQTPWPLEFDFESQDFAWTSEELRSDEVKLRMSGFEFLLKGASRWPASRHHWTAQLKPWNGPVTPVTGLSEWQGSVEAEGEWKQDGKDASPPAARPI